MWYNILITEVSQVYQKAKALQSAAKFISALIFYFCEPSENVFIVSDLSIILVKNLELF